MNLNLTDPREEAKPEDAQSLTKVAEIYYAQGKFAEAISACQQALAHTPHWAPAYVTMGNIQQAQGQLDEAIRLYSEAIALNPDFAEAYANLGSMLYKQGRFIEAIVNYEKALALKSDFAAVHWNLANALKQQGQLETAKIHEQKALALNPQLGGIDIFLKQGNELARQGKLDEALSAWQQALDLNPNLVDAYCQMGIVLRYQGKFKPAITQLQKALELKPDLAAAHQHLCGILRDANDLPAARQAVHKYSQMCGETDPIMTAIYFISTYQVSGLNQIAKDRFVELDAYLSQNLQTATPLELKSLYANFLFSVPYLRDDITANSQLYQSITQQYIQKVFKPLSLPVASPRSQDVTLHKNLKIGFMSNHFNRHPVTWCSLDIIRELVAISPAVYLYATEKFNADDMTDKLAKTAVQLNYPQSYPNGMVNPKEVVAKIRQDDLDVLIDLDSLSVPSHAEILYHQPAPVCISWLGFEAPYISSQNYFLGDWHTHPAGHERYYTEQLLRMPNCFMAVGGFQRIIADKVSLRKANRIDLDQIVYLCVSPGRKFNRELVKAQIAILKQVPNSILLHKGLGDPEVFQAAYQQACEVAGISKHRVKFLPRFLTEEEHRTIYLMADVLLDSYPYNGGSHTLEALWFNLPIVTHTGEQFLSRMGYSFLKSLGIEAGIAYSWEGYVDWGVKFAQSEELRKATKQHLSQSKLPEQLAPLWNPKKFAQDLYNILQELRQKA